MTTRAGRLPDLAADTRFRQRFLSEAGAVAALERELRAGAPRGVLARFAGDPRLWSGDVAAAISWYKKLLVRPDRTELGAALRTLSVEGGAALVARACAEGFPPACDSQRSQPPGLRARRARQQP